MINKNLPEPGMKDRSCAYCGRRGKGLNKGVLIHWPHKDYKKEKVRIHPWTFVEPFSFWSYVCQWCRMAETKRRRNYAKA